MYVCMYVCMLVGLPGEISGKPPNNNTLCKRINEGETLGNSPLVIIYTRL